MDLIEQYRKMHNNQKRFPGFSLKNHVADITNLVEKHDAETLLDYGCGKGYQYLSKRCHEAWGILPHCYDPGVVHLDQKPDHVFDGVICTDVLEHVAEADVREVVSELFWYSEKFVFMSIATFLSRKRLPDGSNCHVTVRGGSWWLSVIRECATTDWVVSFRTSDNEFNTVTG
jgi:hypothetical protein